MWVRLGDGCHIGEVGRGHDLGHVFVEKGLSVLCFSEVGGGAFRTHRGRVGKLVTGVHISAVVIFK